MEFTLVLWKISGWSLRLILCGSFFSSIGMGGYRRGSIVSLSPSFQRLIAPCGWMSSVPSLLLVVCIRFLANVLANRFRMAMWSVNFHKSLLVEININDSWINEAASALHCKIGRVPFMYLGLPIGGYARQLSFWDPVVARMKSRLSEWNSRTLLFGGRLILLKSIISS